MEILDNLEQNNLKFRYRLNPLSGISIFIIGLAIITISVRIIALYNFKNAIQETVNFDSSNILYWGNIIDITTYLHLALFLLSFIPYFMWVYRAYYNLDIVKARGLSTTPGKAVGFHFVPFANLVYIPGVINDLFKGSKHFYEENDPKKSIEYVRTIPWGAAWIVLRVLATILSYMGIARLNGLNFYSKIDSAVFNEVLSNSLNILSGLLIIYLIVIVSKQQNTIYDRQ